jgi:hypothetical protein
MTIRSNFYFFVDTYVSLSEGALLNFIALETVSVKSSQSGMPEWNQIHVRGGNFPEGKCRRQVPAWIEP